MSRREPSGNGRSRVWGPPALLAVVGLLATLLGWARASASVDARTRRRFAEASAQAEASVRREVQAHIELFESIAGFTAADFPPATDRFAYFVQQLELPRRDPAVQGVGLIERVTAAGTPALEARLRADGQPDFHVTAKPEVEDRLVITQFVQLSRKPFVPLGVDFTSLGFRGILAEQSAAPSFLGVSSLARFGVPVRFIPPEVGFYLVAPVHDRTGRDPDATAQGILGWVVAPIEGARFLDQVAGSPASLDLTLGVQAEGQPSEMVAHVPARAGRVPAAALHTRASFLAGGATWILESRGVAFDNGGKGFANGLLAAGIVLSLLLARVWAGRRTARRRTLGLTLALERRERWASVLLESVSDPVVVVADDNTVSYANRAARDLFADGGPVLGLEHIVTRLDPDTLPAVRVQIDRLRGRTGGTERILTRVRTGVDTWVDLECSVANRLDDPAIHGLVADIRDVTEHMQIESILEHEVQHDALTGLVTRAHLYERLHAALDERRSRQEEVGVLFVDLDHFKRVNDDLGHAAGDELLRAVAARLQSAVRASDTVARVGGDEFVVFCGGLSGPDQALAVAEKLRDALRSPVEIAGAEVTVTASIGIAMGDRAADPDDLVRAADRAMYRAKRAGRDRVERAVAAAAVAGSGEQATPVDAAPGEVPAGRAAHQA